jgi:predicted dehydrogenase
MPEIRLLTLNPGHFHAALVQKEMYPGVAPQVHVYGPLGPDLIAHLGRVAGFNARAAQPTSWELEVHANPDAAAQMLREKLGNVVVLAGRNRVKIDCILASVQAGLNVLADKPWILVPEDLAKLQQALDTAAKNGLHAYDIMTERFEITSILQRELVRDIGVFGKPVPGTAEEPGVFMESVHFLKKTVAGTPLRRPPWFFDVHEQGEGLSDVGTHLVDLVPWILFHNQSEDIKIVAARRWPTALTRADYQQVTGESDFPEECKGQVKNETLEYYCNTWVHYALRGTRVQMNILWDLEAAPGAGDTHLAIFRGTRSRIEVRQGAEQRYRPELFVDANNLADVPALRKELDRRVALLQIRYPGLVLRERAGRERAGRFHLEIPDAFRVGHEAHFSEVTRQFLRYLRGQDQLPAWEKDNMVAKYRVTTEGMALSRSAAGRVPGT